MALDLQQRSAQHGHRRDHTRHENEIGRVILQADPIKYGGITAASSAVAGKTIAHPVDQYDATVQPSDLPQEFLPREVDIIQGFEPFEIHVVPQEFAMYWTLPNDRALRYTVGIGRPGLYEQGEFYVGALRKWPSWTPTPAMIRRQPDVYKQFEDGVPGGPENPLGARGIYLYQPGRGDTMLRIHGTDEPDTLGQAVSNGCARLVNDQLIEFYDRVPIGTRVVLYPTTDNFTLLRSDVEATL